MNSLLKSATIQVRVTPLVKAASEQVIWGIGITMSEAVELFLRRLIVDKRIPFEVITLDPARFEETLSETPHIPEQPASGRRVNRGTVVRGTRPNEKSKNFFGGVARPSKFGRETREKRG